MLGVSSIFSKPKARSAPCSPATINNNNGVAKRPRSPGSLSPLPSPFYDDDIKRYVQNHHNSSHYLREVPDFALEKRSSKKHRVEPPPPNDSVVSVKVSSSPPNTPHNLISPPPSYHDQQPQRSQPQFPFPPQIVTSEDQPSSTLQPPQQPYFPHVSPPPPPQQSRQPSPKQQDYPSPTNNPSQFLNSRNITSSHHMVQPQQPPTSSQSQAVVIPPPNQSQQRFAPFASRRNNVNSGNNNNNNNSNSNNNVQGAKKCESCHTSSSPEWRRGPTGHKTLCNACGLRYSRTIARENRKREQAQREQEQRQREQREREERARERAAATVMMQRAIEPFPQYRPSNVMMTPGQQQHHHHHSSTHSSHPSGPPQYHPSTLPPLNYHLNNQPQLPQPPTSHHQQYLNVHHSQPQLNDRGRYTLPSPHLFDRQQNGAGGYNPVVTDNHRKDHNDENERYNTNMMNNMPPTANAYPKEAYFGRAQ